MMTRGRYDWGEKSLEEMIEELGEVKLAPRGVAIHPELTAVEKHLAFEAEMAERDQKKEAELVMMRQTIDEFVASEGGRLSEAEVAPVGGASKPDA